MKRHYRHFLEDINEYSDKAILFIQNMTFNEFIEDEKTYMATVRALEIIGEAIRHILEEIKQKYREIPWHEIIGFRNTVIHEYFGIDKSIVWNTATIDTLFLKEQISHVLQNVGEYE